MTVVSLINRKGGVGKTTLTLALADHLSSLYRKRILLLDLDSQANLSTAAIGEERWQDLDRGRQTVADVFEAVVQRRSVPPHVEPVRRIKGALPVQLVASTPRLADIEADAMEGATEWRRRVGSPYLVLQQVLGPLCENFDYVLIDCPPSIGVITLNGLALSDGYLIPVMPSPIAVSGIELLVGRIQKFAKGLGRTLRRYGTVVNRIDTRTQLHHAITSELKKNPEAEPVWASQIRASVRAEEGWDQPGPRTLIQRWGTLHADFAALTEEFLRRVP
ncbi:ParA family protein [Archangium sp.]|uniref:ParA family protein n=1 Tax=Archangium sp. TaxID=1872627 RepID=UPI00286AFDEE|nr:ParA family protein [Archangium sp.]